MTQEEKTLSEALSFARIGKLPEEYKVGSTKIWTRAVVKVKKLNGRTNYALAMNDGNGSPRIVRDFGDMVAIKSVVAIYPYEFAPSDITPNLRNKKEIEQFLVFIGHPEEKVKQLLSNEDKDGNPKTDEQKAEDKSAVKRMVEQYVVKKAVSIAKSVDKAKVLQEQHDIFGEASQESRTEFEKMKAKTSRKRANQKPE